MMMVEGKASFGRKFWQLAVPSECSAAAEKEKYVDLMGERRRRWESVVWFRKRFLHYG